MGGGSRSLERSSCKASCLPLQTQTTGQAHSRPPDLAWVPAARVGGTIPSPLLSTHAPCAAAVQREAAGAVPLAGGGTTGTTHPQLADEGSCLLHRQLALLPHDALDSLEDVPSHGDIPADVDVASLLLQRSEDGLGQLLLQHVLHVFLREEEEMGGESSSALATCMLWPAFQAVVQCDLLFRAADLHPAAPTARGKTQGKAAKHC